MGKEIGTSTAAIHSQEITDRFVQLITWARGGSLVVVTPYIGDFTIRGKAVSSRIAQIMRGTTGLTLIVAPPKTYHRSPDKCPGKSQDKCYFCKGASTYVRILDYYSTWANRVLVMSDLHAKVYIAWNHLRLAKCLTGSVNLTKQAFRYYKEIGIYTTNQKLIEKIFGFILIWTKRRSRKHPRTGKTVEMVEPYWKWRQMFLSRYPHIADLVTRGITR